MRLLLAFAFLALPIVFAASDAQSAASATQSSSAGCMTTGAIAFDDTNVYWATESSAITNNADPNVVWTMPRSALLQAASSGGALAPRKLMTARGPVSLAVDATDVFVAQTFDVSPVSGPHYRSWIAKVSKGGGASPVIIAKDRNNPSNLSLDAKRIYWSDASGVHAANKDGSDLVTLYPKSTASMVDDLGSDSLYISGWSAGGICGECPTGKVERGGRILQISKSRAHAPRVVADKLLEVQSLTQDKTHLYVSMASSYDPNNGSVVSIDKKSGTINVVARGQDIVTPIAVSDNDVFFATTTAGIMSTPKKSHGSTPTLWLAGGQRQHFKHFAIDQKTLFVTGSVPASRITVCKGQFTPADPGFILWGAF